MNRLNVISLRMEEVEIVRLDEIDFERLRLDLKLLAQQPPVEVHPCYRDKEIDYGTGYRKITVNLEFREGLPDFSYFVNDRANVRDSVNHGDFVGSKRYSQNEIDALRE